MSASAVSATDFSVTDVAVIWPLPLPDYGRKTHTYHEIRRILARDIMATQNLSADKHHLVYAKYTVLSSS